MNKMIVALISASFFLAPAAFAQDHKKPPASQQQPIILKKGKMLPPEHRGHRVSDQDFKQRKLRSAGHGERWVEVDGTYVLINVATGLIVSAMGR